MDPLGSVKPWKDTTYYLMRACRERGQEVGYTDPQWLFLRHDRLHARVQLMLGQQRLHKTNVLVILGFATARQSPVRLWTVRLNLDNPLEQSVRFAGLTVISEVIGQIVHIGRMPGLSSYCFFEP